MSIKNHKYKQKGGSDLNIKDRREQLGISQKELAEKCGVAQSTMCDIEQGRCKPSLQVALQIAKALGVKDIKFFDEDE